MNFRSRKQSHDVQCNLARYEFAVNSEECVTRGGAREAFPCVALGSVFASPRGSRTDVASLQVLTQAKAAAAAAAAVAAVAVFS